MKRTGPITDGLWRRWPIPKEGAEIEVARYRREATSSKNAVEHMFFIRIRIVATGLLKSIEFRSYWRERDVVTEREFYDFPIPCGEAEVQILSVREKKRWLGLW